MHDQRHKHLRLHNRNGESITPDGIAFSRGRNEVGQRADVAGRSCDNHGLCPDAARCGNHRRLGDDATWCDW